jgi:hypothetical protein
MSTGENEDWRGVRQRIKSELTSMCTGELPENAKINETDTFADEGEGGFEFAEDDEEGSGSDNEVDVDDI